MTNAQKLQLERIRAASFNDMDGDEVANDLEKHEHLYKSFVFGRFKYGYLIELRDLYQDCINADTLMILTKKENLKEIYSLAKKWKADEIGYSLQEGNVLTPVNTAPFFESKELHMALGGTLLNGEALVRIWWD